MRAPHLLRRRGERGAALLVAIVAVAILTALAVDVAYETRVGLQISANARDELRASYLARSGVALSRLVLGFQQQIDDAAGAACGLASGAQRRVQGAAAAPPPGACPRPQIWSTIPVSSGLVQALFGGEAAPPPAGEGPRTTAFGDFEGSFDVRIEDEGRKVNAQLDGLGTGTLGPQVHALYQLVCNPRWDFLFDREDANGVRVTRQDWIVYLRDWVDDDEVSDALVASFPGAPCLMIPGAKPFEPGFGDEDLPYDRGEERYKAKNARLDSTEELHLVAGVSDVLMSAFGDRLTVYLAREAPRNVNTLDPRELLELAWLVADPPGQPALLDPELPGRLQAAVADLTMGGFLTISPLQFAAIVEAFGVRVNTLALDPKSPRQFLTDRAIVFRLRSEGTVGAVKKTVDAVVTFDPEQNRLPGLPQGSTPQQRQAQQALQQVGLPPGTAAGISPGAAEKPSRLIRWREE